MKLEGIRVLDLSNFLPGLLTPDDGGLIMHSRSVF